MKFLVGSLFSLSSLAVTFSFPATPIDPVRILPYNWAFKIVGLRGPGCPESTVPTGDGFQSRLTYGENTMDGSEIYKWFAALPSLRVDLAEQIYSWCETDIEYTEFANAAAGDVPTADYRLRLHKNGTAVIATYDLDEGVKASWAFSYMVTDSKPSKSFTFSDFLTVKGPYQSGKYAQYAITDISSAPNELIEINRCGAAKFTIRVDIRVEGAKGKTGIVESEKVVVGDKTNFYGVQEGWSYDWQKCDQ